MGPFPLAGPELETHVVQPIPPTPPAAAVKVHRFAAGRAMALLQAAKCPRPETPSEAWPKAMKAYFWAFGWNMLEPPGHSVVFCISRPNSHDN